MNLARYRYISKRKIIYTLIFLSLLMPSTVVHYPIAFRIVQLTRTVAFLFSGLLLVRKSVPVDELLKAIFVYMIAQVVTTALTTGNVVRCVSDLYPTIALCVLSKYYYTKDRGEFLDRIGTIFAIFMLINFISWIMGGMYIDLTSSYGTERIVYFFGIRNMVGYFSVVAFPFILMLIQNKKKRILLLAGCAVTIYFIFAEHVSAAIMTLAVFSAGILLLSDAYGKLRNIYKILSVSVVIFVLAIVVFQLQNYFSVILIDLLGESLDLNGRTIIWDSVLSQIQGVNWIIGHGTGFQKQFYLNGKYTTFAHNQYLAILFDYGLIGLLGFLNVQSVAIKSFMRNSKPENKLLFMGIIAALLGGIVEAVCDTPYYFFMIVIAYNMNIVSTGEK